MSDNYHIMRMNGMSPSGLPMPERQGESELAPARGSASRRELQDTDLMPFGKYKGTPMQDVPASYLHWLWTQNNGRDQRTQMLRSDPVLDYIRRNLSALKQEHEDGIW